MAQRAGHPRPFLRGALLQSRGSLSVRFCGQRLAKLLKMESYRLINEKSDITTPNTSLMPCLPALPACAKIKNSVADFCFCKNNALQATKFRVKMEA